MSLVIFFKKVNIRSVLILNGLRVEAVDVQVYMIKVQCIQSETFCNLVDLWYVLKMCML